MRLVDCYRSVMVLLLAIISVIVASAQPVVAVIDGHAVQATELEKFLGNKLLRIKAEEYGIQISTLNEYLDQMLLSREAEKRGISIPELLRREVTERVVPITDVEARAVLDSSSRTSEPADDRAALKTAVDELSRRRVAKRRSEFLKVLRQQYRTEIKLEPPRLAQPITGGQSRGPSEAAVSIVVFSDFQCPFCANVDSSLRRLDQEYRGRLRITIKQFPIAAHRQATKAAEAALCASEQNLYWEMHNALFSDQRSVALEQFSDLARGIALDVKDFESCMIAHRSAAEVVRDVADARSLGINSTPTLFINGLLVIGAKPYVELREIIDSELRRSLHNGEQPLSHLY